jgi:CRISPR/Cas system-associated exonuclease Cas4 (RecB family)
MDLFQTFLREFPRQFLQQILSISLSNFISALSLALSFIVAKSNQNSGKLNEEIHREYLKLKREQNRLATEQNRISKQQNILERLRVEVARYPRREYIYNKVMDFIECVVYDVMSVDRKLIEEFSRETRTAEVLFGENIASYVNALTMKAYELHMLHLSTDKNLTRDAFDDDASYFKYCNEKFWEAEKLSPKRKKLEKFFRKQERRAPRIFYSYLMSGKFEWEKV